MIYPDFVTVIQNNEINDAHRKAIKYLAELYGIDAAEDINRLHQLGILLNIFREAPTLSRITYTLRVMMHVNDMDEAWFRKRLMEAERVQYERSTYSVLSHDGNQKDLNVQCSM